MTLTANLVLAMFAMLAVSSLSFFVAKRLKVPHTVFLVALGVLFVPLSLWAPLSFLQEFTLTPELLFYIFLPALIFESAYAINIRRFVEDLPAITLLAVASLLISSFAIAFGLSYALSFIGIEVPLIVTLLFGVLISATDPVAVLALFKEYGAPRRLSLIFEGESLFNDATALALFLVVLEIAIKGFSGIETLADGVGMFGMMLAGGIVFGLFMGILFSHLIGWTRKSEFASITLTIAVAHLTFILSEVISHHTHFYLSSIIATTIAAMVIGNYGKAKISAHAEEFVEKFWQQFAFLVNSLVFILIGMLVVKLPVSEPAFIVPVLLSIAIVASARALSVYPVISAYNYAYTYVGHASRTIPASWQHLLSWGSLRGALAVTMVLLIPPDLAIAGWGHSYSVQEFLLALTVGCIFATLFLKATTIAPLMRFLKLDSLRDIEQLEYNEARALIHGKVLERINNFASKGYIKPDIHAALTRHHQTRYQSACVECHSENFDALSYRVLRMYAIGIEHKYVKELLAYGEINEAVYKRITGKLAIQHEHVDKGLPLDTIHTPHDNKDIFEVLAKKIAAMLKHTSQEETVALRYMYYRALSIISRKVVKELCTLSEDLRTSVFSKNSFEKTLEVYRTFRHNSTLKMSMIAAEYPEITSALSKRLAQRAAYKVEEHMLAELLEKQMITPKVFVALRDEFELEKNELLPSYSPDTLPSQHSHATV